MRSARVRRSGAAAMALALLLGILGACAPSVAPPDPSTRLDFPTVDPDYIYNQLFTMATQFQHREAGYDANLPVAVNGHDEFAAYWGQEMTKQLDGFGPVVRRDPFPVAGWVGRSAPVPAFNLDVTVPGLAHPEQVVVIGCHYDGEAVSTQSAYDDASGCAIELGVAKALAEYWRANKVYPARTLRFVLFDAEEQGLYGSFHYVNETINGELGAITAMINEEQNGIAYPLRFLGNSANPLLPLEINMPPLASNRLYRRQDQLSAAQRQAIARFRDLAGQAVPAAFQQFRALGFTSLPYRVGDGTAAQPVFAVSQTGNVRVQDDVLGSSDQMPFTLAGLPTAMIVGNYSYYDSGTPPPWSYPYDQRDDTIQLMNVYASGAPDKSEALALALALPGMLSTWLLSQPDVLGTAPADGAPTAAIGDVGQTVAGRPLALDAAGYLPGGSGGLTYAWDFGDGAKAQGASVRHTYAAPGSYTLALTVSAGAASRKISLPLKVGNSATVVPNPYEDYPSTGSPRTNPNVNIPRVPTPAGQ